MPTLVQSSNLASTEVRIKDTTGVKPGLIAGIVTSLFVFVAILVIVIASVAVFMLHRSKSYQIRERSA